MKANPGEAFTVERQKCPTVGGKLDCLPWFTPRRAERQTKPMAKANRNNEASAIGGESHLMGESRQPVAAKAEDWLMRGDAGQTRRVDAVTGNRDSNYFSAMSGNESEGRQRR